MKIRHYKMAWWDKPFKINRNRCYCTRNACGDRWHTYGWTIYLFGYGISIIFDKPKGCDALF